MSDMIILATATSNNLASNYSIFSYTIILYYVCVINVKSNLRFLFFIILY